MPWIYFNTTENWARFLWEVRVERKLNTLVTKVKLNVIILHYNKRNNRPSQLHVETQMLKSKTKTLDILHLHGIFGVYFSSSFRKRNSESSPVANWEPGNPGLSHLATRVAGSDAAAVTGHCTTGAFLVGELETLEHYSISNILSLAALSLSFPLIRAVFFTVSPSWKSNPTHNWMTKQSVSCARLKRAKGLFP